MRNTYTLFALPKEGQRGINMVDLMMWLVIAALLLAAALQSIGYYQKASWNYALKNDLSNIRSFMEASYSVNGYYPTTDELKNAAGSQQLPLSNGNYISNVFVSNSAGEWKVRLCSTALRDSLSDANGSALRIYRSDPNLYEASQCNI